MTIVPGCLQTGSCVLFLVKVTFYAWTATQAYRGARSILTYCSVMDGFHHATGCLSCSPRAAYYEEPITGAWQIHHWLLESGGQYERSQVSELAFQARDCSVLTWHPHLTSQLIYAFSEGEPSIHIIDGSQNICIHLWKLPGQQCVWSEKVLGLEWSPDGFRLAAITAGYVHKFNLAGLASGKNAMAYAIDSSTVLTVLAPQ